MKLIRLGLIALTLVPLRLAAQNVATEDVPPGTTDCGKLATHVLTANCNAKYSQTRVLYLANTSQQNDANEILVAVRNMVDPSTKIYLLSSQNAIVLNTYPEELNRIEALIHQLDRPHKTYRLTYTLTDFDNGTRVGTQHNSMLMLSGQRTVMKQGDKIPVVTGSAGKASDETTTFQYLDIGMNFDATMDETASGARLRSKVEQSSATESRTIAEVTEPVVRQTVLENTALLTLGKPQTLGSLDITGTTRHVEISVLLELVQ
jgi:type II secretory pathway component GspD/PulD (secretin)